MRRWLGAIGLVAGILGAGAAVARGQGAAPAPAPAPAAAPPEYRLVDFGVMPRPSFRAVLLGMPAVQADLPVPAGREAEAVAAARRQLNRRSQALRSARDPQQRHAAIAAAERESRAALEAILGPRGCDRLAEIQLQAQGPLAFSRAANPEDLADGPGLAGRLGLTDDQVRRVRTIAEAGEAEIDRACSFPLALDAGAGVPSPEAIRRYVESPEFLAARRRAAAAARLAWAETIGRVEAELTAEQRATYRTLLGAPFDLARIPLGEGQAAFDAELVGVALGANRGGQRPDPDFDARVARPAYRGAGPRVLFDEAHRNFHTADGRYKPFADLIAADGYAVTPNRDPFAAASLARADILVIANALPDQPDDAPGPAAAFTAAEADAVRDWVGAGGSLLLITDHEPFGSGSAGLAERFGVGMSKQYTADPANSEGPAESWLVFARARDLIGDHPITAGRDPSERIDRVKTFTGQSLLGPPASRPLLKLAATAVDLDREDKATPAAGRSQGLALPFGRGRVVVLGEAGELSAQLVGAERFGMNVPGIDNRQFALNIMHWLSGLLEPRAEPARPGGTPRQARPGLVRPSSAG